MPIREVNQVVNEIVSLLAGERKQKKISLEELSKMSGVSKKHICNIENSKVIPSLQVLCKIAEPLGLTIDIKVMPKAI